MSFWNAKDNSPKDSSKDNIQEELDLIRGDMWYFVNKYIACETEECRQDVLDEAKAFQEFFDELS